MSKKYFLLILILAIALATGGYFYFGRRPEAKYEFVTAQRGDLIQEVSVTGRVKPAESVELAFEKTGRVSAVYVEVGQRVGVGQILAALDDTELTAQLKQAKANVKVEQAKLAELKSGTRPEDIEIQQIKVRNYEIALEDAKINLADKLRDLYTKADDAIRNKTDQFFSNPRTNNPELLFSASNELKTDTERKRLGVESALISWQQKLGELGMEDDFNPFIFDGKKYSAQVRSFLDQAALLINGLTASSQFSQATIDAWKGDTFTARANLNTAVNNLSVAEEKLRTAESNLILAEQELVLKQAGTIPEQISAQEAKEESVLASVDNLQAQIRKTVLRSSITGVVSSQKAKIGEIAAANTVVVSLIPFPVMRLKPILPKPILRKLK